MTRRLGPEQGLVRFPSHLDQCLTKETLTLARTLCTTTVPLTCEFETKDRDKTPVRCGHATWNGHIVDEHPEMAGHQSAVSQTIRDPVYVYQSTRYANRRIHYRPFILPGPYHQYFLMVVIAYDRRGNRTYGEIVTAFPTANTKEGDILRWSKFQTTT